MHLGRITCENLQNNSSVHFYKLKEGKGKVLSRYVQIKEQDK